MQTECSAQDQYYGYSGALQCMIDDAGDIAFVKHSTYEGYVSEVRSDNPKSRPAAGNKVSVQHSCLL